MHEICPGRVIIAKYNANIDKHQKGNNVTIIMENCRLEHIFEGAGFQKYVPVSSLLGNIFLCIQHAQFVTYIQY